jgi:hypothetical protein
MAKVSSQVQRDIDFQLDVSFESWERLPEVEATIDDWDQIDQIVFIEEWPLEEGRLRWLERWKSEGLLTPGQLKRYAKLQALVAKNRPILQRLRES